ncbi:DnaD domain-containing protein [Alkalicoccobacillus porphyridii]|uniref:DnaD domain-containing protein n=1 Tax=Alkalicoccobacillus porphyridii TaxID=2597270 RepID=A0A553ZZU5_9BACI|nr:DnaD domain-containing protein [Alkalicoccobacillus porphyridii]TSB46952.1 DnaD domain-containing protein [Alkalicoccobacillus porphyridii]
MKKNQVVKWISQKHVHVPALLLSHYTELGLTEHELVSLLHIQSFIDEGEEFPTPLKLSERMSLSHEDCTKVLSRLIRTQLLGLEKKSDEMGILYETYSLEPLWLRLYELIERQEFNVKQTESHELEGKLYQQMEQEFGRPLSPIEGETLSMWIDQDQHAPELIFAALKEAVISGKLNFRYIDRILFEWKKNGIRSTEQAKSHSEKFRNQNQGRRNEKEPIKTDGVPGFSWLEQS